MALRTRAMGPIAIDFGAYALRAMQLTGRGNQQRVHHCALHVYPTHTGSQGLDRNEVIEALRGILKTKKFVGKKVVTALGQHELIAKSIRLPDIPETELAPAVEFEAAERISGLEEDAEIRFIPSGTLVGESEQQQEVLVLAAKASVIHQHLELLTELGLESACIDAVPCAIFRPFERYLRRTADQDQVNAFVDIGQTSSWIIIVRGNQIALARSVDVGGLAFDRLVGAQLSLDPKEAGELRRRIARSHSPHGNSSTPVDSETRHAVDSAEGPAWEKLGKEIGLCSRYFAVTFRGERPENVTCVGGESLNQLGLSHLSEVTGMECRVGYPLRQMLHTDTVPHEDDSDSLAEWATCAGLSMKPLTAAVEKVYA